MKTDSNQETAAVFAFCTVVGVLAAPFAVLVWISRWALNEIGEAWDDLRR